MSLDLLEALARRRRCVTSSRSRLHARKQLCHSAVTPEARSSSFIANRREAETSTCVISNHSSKLSLSLSLFFLRTCSYHLFFPHPFLYCFLHSSPQWAAHHAEVNTDVSLCLQAKAAVQRNFIFSESNKSTHLDLHHHVWPRLQSVPHAGPSDTRFPFPAPPEPTVLIISVGLLVLISELSYSPSGIVWCLVSKLRLWPTPPGV